jgi:hypothetical protein
VNRNPSSLTCLISKQKEKGGGRRSFEVHKSTVPPLMSHRAPPILRSKRETQLRRCLEQMEPPPWPPNTTTYIILIGQWEEEEWIRRRWWVDFLAVGVSNREKRVSEVRRRRGCGRRRGRSHFRRSMIRATGRLSLDLTLSSRFLSGTKKHTIVCVSTNQMKERRDKALFIPRVLRVAFYTARV